MKRNFLALALPLVLILPLAAPAHAGAAGETHQARSQADVVDVAIGSPDHTTLVAAVQAAGLVATLKGQGPFTVFAPTNAAFDALPAGTVETLLKPENKADLGGVLTYHVVPGKVDAATLTAQIAAGNGKATLKTVQGGTLTASLDGGRVLLTDARNGRAHVTAADLAGDYGMVHVIDGVLLP